LIINGNTLCVLNIKHASSNWGDDPKFFFKELSHRQVQQFSQSACDVVGQSLLFLEKNKDGETELSLKDFTDETKTVCIPFNGK